MAPKGTGVLELSAANFHEAVAGEEAVLVYFSCDGPIGLGFEEQFAELAVSEEVEPRLLRLRHTEPEIAAEAGVDPSLGGSLVLYKQGRQLGKVSLKDMNESEEQEMEVAKWLGGKYPDSTPAPAAPRPPSAPARAPLPNPSQPTNVTVGAALSGPPPGPKAAAVLGQTPGAPCGAPPAGPPPGPRPGVPAMGSPNGTMTVGAALSGPPPAPKAAAVPGQTPGAPCGAPPAGPPPGQRPGMPAMGQPNGTMTIGAALSGPPPAPKAAAVPGQTPGAPCGAPPSGPPGPGSRAGLSGPPPEPKAVAVLGQAPAALAGPPDALQLEASSILPEQVSGPPVLSSSASQPALPKSGARSPLSPSSLVTSPTGTKSTPSFNVPAVPAAPTPPPEPPLPAPQAPVPPSPPSPQAEAWGEPKAVKVVAIAEPETEAPLPPASPAPAPAPARKELTPQEGVAQLFAAHPAVSREKMKAFLQHLLSKQGAGKRLAPAQLDRLVAEFQEDSSAIKTSQFIQWVWSGAGG